MSDSCFIFIFYVWEFAQWSVDCKLREKLNEIILQFVTTFPRRLVRGYAQFKSRITTAKVRTCYGRLSRYERRVTKEEVDYQIRIRGTRKSFFSLRALEYDGDAVSPFWMRSTQKPSRGRFLILNDLVTHCLVIVTPAVGGSKQNERSPISVFTIRLPL